MDKCGALVNCCWQGNTAVLGESRASVPLCPQFPHGMAWYL